MELNFEHRFITYGINITKTLGIFIMLGINAGLVNVGILYTALNFS